MFDVFEPEAFSEEWSELQDAMIESLRIAEVESDPIDELRIAYINTLSVG